MKQIKLFSLLTIIFLITSCGEQAKKQNPEKQISFVLEEKPHEYYVKQSELWWKEIEKDSTSEDSWFNYYRACRNTQGTADWREDFVDESPYLKLGKDIVELMEANIPNTFTYFYVKGSTGGVDPGAGDYLMKAYKMNPKFAGIHPNVVTYSVSTLNPALRKEVNIEWAKRDDINPGLFLYAKNVLSSIEPNGVLLTQHDNDTYPIWMLQDVQGLRNDVKVINIDFLLLENYREDVFNELGIKPFGLDSIDIDEYRDNWKNVVHHFLGNYPKDRPLHIALTVSPNWYKGFIDSLQLSGLTYIFSDEEANVVVKNKRLFEEAFNLDSLNHDFKDYHSQRNVIQMNVNYLRPFKMVYDNYMNNDNQTGAAEIRRIANQIAIRTKDEEIIEKTNLEFGSR